MFETEDHRRTLPRGFDSAIGAGGVKEEAEPAWEEIDNGCWELLESPNCDTKRDKKPTTFTAKFLANRVKKSSSPIKQSCCCQTTFGEGGCQGCVEAAKTSK